MGSGLTSYSKCSSMSLKEGLTTNKKQTVSCRNTNYASIENTVDGIFPLVTSKN